MPRGKKSDIKITLTKDENVKEMTFATKDGIDWLKVEIFTCFGDRIKQLKVCFKITPAIEEESLCKILACYKLIHSIKSLKIENKMTYAEKISVWFEDRKIKFINNKECLIEMGTTIPAIVRLKSVVNFVIESIVTSLLMGLTEKKNIDKLDQDFKDWISSSFSGGYVIQSLKDKRQKKH